MRFFTRSCAPERIPSPRGTLTVPEYQLRYVKGREQLVKIGEKPLAEAIKAASDGISIADKLARWRHGDESALGTPGGSYGDFTQLPKTLAEAQQFAINAQSTFESLPLEVRSTYGHNLGDFLAAVESGEYQKKFGKAPVKAEPAPSPASAPSSAPASKAELAKDLKPKFEKFIQEVLDV